MDDLNASFNLDDLLSDMQVQLIIHKVYIEALTAFLKETVERLSLSPEGASSLLKAFDKSLQQKLQTLKHENPVIHAALQQKLKRDLGDIPGIRFSDDDTQL